MAKIKVHELAKEVDKQSKEVIAFLQNKGIEVKAAQSSVEEAAADMVRRELGKKTAVPEPAGEAKTAEKAKTGDGPKAGDGGKAQSRPETARGERTKQEPVKKKNNINFVSNPHNSKLPQRSGAGSGSGAGASGNGNRRGRNNNNNDPMRRPLIRPLTPPSPAPSVGQIKPDRKSVV